MFLILVILFKRREAVIVLLLPASDAEAPLLAVEGGVPFAAVGLRAEAVKESLSPAKVEVEAEVAAGKVWKGD